MIVDNKVGEDITVYGTMASLVANAIKRRSSTLILLCEQAMYSIDRRSSSPLEHHDPPMSNKDEWVEEYLKLGILDSKVKIYRAKQALFISTKWGTHLDKPLYEYSWIQRDTGIPLYQFFTEENFGTNLMTEGMSTWSPLFKAGDEPLGPSETSTLLFFGQKAVNRIGSYREKLPEPFQRYVKVNFK